MNLEAIFYKHNKFILTGIVLLAMVVVYGSLRNTLVKLTRYSELKEKLEGISAEPLSRGRRVDLEQWEKLDINSHTFRAVSDASSKYNVVIERMEPAQVVRQDGFEVFTRKITLQGRYVDILQCLASMLKDLTHIKIVSVNFVKEQRNKAPVLIAEVYFQTVKPE